MVLPIVLCKSKTKPIKLASNLWALLCAQQDMFYNLFIKYCWEIRHLQTSLQVSLFFRWQTFAHFNCFGWKISRLYYRLPNLLQALIHLYNPHLIYNTLNAEGAWIEWRHLAFHTNLGHCYAHQLRPCDALKCSQVCTVKSPNTHLWCWLRPPWCVSCQLFMAPGQSSCAHFRITCLSMSRPTKKDE